MNATTLDDDVALCVPCNTYFQRRNPTILAAGVRSVAVSQRMTQHDVKVRFATGLHARHLAGKSIEVTTPHPMGPPRMPSMVAAGRFAALMAQIAKEERTA